MSDIVTIPGIGSPYLCAGTPVMVETRGFQRIFEIGSRRSHFVSGRSAHTITLTALMTPPGGNVERNCR